MSLCLTCFVLITLLFATAAPATATTKIQLNSSLSASNTDQSWSSPSNTFSLSFTPVLPTTTPPSFTAAISFSGGVPIWSAGNSLAVDSLGSLRLDSDGALRLINGSGSTLWSSGTAGRGVSSAALEDSGNLVLINSSGGTVWSSFDNPTDVIVPGQNFTVGKNLTSGDYFFTLQGDGNLTLKWNNSFVYYNTGLNSSANVSLFAPSLGVEQIGQLSLFDNTLNGKNILAYSSDYGQGDSSRLRFVRLDSDGNLRLYSSDSGSGTISLTWAAVSDQCEVFNYCGSYGICTYNDTGPFCICPSENFEFVDKGNSRKGCKRKVELDNCPNNPTMLELDHTILLTYPPQLVAQQFFAGIAACRANCLSNSGSSCVASTSLSDGSGHCYFKTADFISGYQSPSLPSTSFIKICGAAAPNPPISTLVAGKRKTLHAWIVVVVVLATLLVLVAVEGSLWWFCCRNSPKFGTLSAQYALLEYASGAPVQFSYKELQRATKGFKEKLGVGGFGAVYKGILANKTVAAVKQLEGIEQGEKQFRMEVATISSTHHLNLVRLIGFCSEGRHRLLVYEFMRNGSLDNFLFVPDSEKILTWEQRFNIAIGTARGITYLHEECRDCIVHCDIKPENILLDDNYNAKVSDFGLAKLINPKDHRYRTLTSVRGTRGYLAPEWLANLPITSKSDVYSYGMVLLETVSGKRNFEVSEGTNNKKFSTWAYEEFEKGNVRSIVDKRLADHDMDMEQVMRAIQVSFWCIQEQPSQRPMMGKVVRMLEGITEIEKPPAPTIVTEGSTSGTSINISSNVSALSTFAASAPGPSSCSSVQTAGVSPLASGRNVERASSSLLWSDSDRK